MVDNDSTNELKSIVSDTMCAFAINDECVEKLVQFNVIEKLLDLLKKKTQIFSVVDMLAKLNNYGILSFFFLIFEIANFQRKIFEVGGLKPVIEMLESKSEHEREAGLKAIAPFVATRK